MTVAGGPNVPASAPDALGVHPFRRLAGAPPVVAGLERTPVAAAVWMSWLSAGAYRANLLVECPTESADATVAQMMSWAAAPLRFCQLPGPLDLPAVPGGTLVLHDVAALTTGQQVALFDWLTVNAGAVQVVSLTGCSLRDRVADGCFLEGLYYRLNMIKL